MPQTIFRPVHRLAGLLLCVLMWPAHANDFAELVLDAHSGRVLHDEQADEQRYPASLTKMMTLYLVFEQMQRGRLRLNDQVRVSAHAAAQPPTGLSLQAGDRFSIRDGILALVIRSANDASAALAEHLAGSEAAFAQRMTRKARELGLRRTVFRNASGLPDPEQVTTARDMALLGRALVRDFPQYYGYFSTESFEFAGRTYTSHNHLLGSYAGADGIKTGFIRASGYNLVASAERSGVRLVAAVLGGSTIQGRDERMRELLDAGFDQARQLGLRAAPAPSLPDERPSIRLQATPERSGGWSIQVGAFTDPGTALAWAGEVRDRHLRDSAAATTPATAVSSGRRVLHRALLSGFTSNSSAQAACAHLKSQKLDCMTVAPTD